MRNPNDILTTIYPTDTSIDQINWLHARNNKYSNVDTNKVGKWMLFVPAKKVNQIWDKIKKSVANQLLWHAKVSTHNPRDKNTHAIMIYTKDYTDLDDVIAVLDYLEQTNIKPKHQNIRYKADYQTHAGIYSGGKNRPWLYESKNIRSLIKTNQNPSPAADGRQELYTIPQRRR